MSDTSPRHDPYAPWRIHDYRCFQASWFAMTFAKQVEMFAVSIYFIKHFSQRDSLLAIGLMALVQALPFIVLAIPGGQIADRFQRRSVVLSMLVIGVAASTGLLVLAGYQGPVWGVYALLTLGATGLALGNPSRAALMPQLVPTEVFHSAITWSSSIFHSATVLGPVAGSAIIWVFDDNPAAGFAMVVACRLVALGAATMIRHRSMQAHGGELSWKSVLAGVRFVWHTKLILATITLDLFAVLLGGAIYLLPYYSMYILKVGTLGFGFLRAADAVGAVCMAILLAHLPPMRRAGVTLLWAVAGFGAWTIVFGVSTSFWVSLIAMFLVGSLDNISVVVRHTLVQMLTPDEMRGRVSAVNGVFIVASNEVGGLESNLVAWLLTPAISVVAGGVGTILVVLGAMCIWPQILKIGSLASIKPIEPESVLNDGDQSPTDK
jgi:MFS family permease